MSWKMKVKTIFAEAIKLLSNWQYLPKDTRVVIREENIIYVWTIQEDTIAQITSMLDISPNVIVEFWSPNS
jgi:hypothetical protein